MEIASDPILTKPSYARARQAVIDIYICIYISGIQVV